MAQGTPVYMSPEMYKKMKLIQENPLEKIQDLKKELENIDYLKSDIYSLGLSFL